MSSKKRTKSRVDSNLGKSAQNKRSVASDRSVLKWNDENIESSDSEDEPRGAPGTDDAAESDDDGDETGEQRRKRLAKEYLENMQYRHDIDSSDSDGDGDGEVEEEYGVLSERLRHERLEAQGKYYRNIAESVGSISDAGNGIIQMNVTGHKQSVTCVALASDDATIYSGSKDNSLLSWDTETGQKKAVIRPRWNRKTHGSLQAWDGEILCVASTTDGKYVVCGGRDKAVRVHDTRAKNAEVKCFQGHRDVVTSLAFRRDSYSLFSGSMDRCLKHWDLNEMGYLETMFGHQDYVNAIDCWTQDKPISASNDRTLRIWKVSDESHLVLRGHKGNIDAVSIMTENLFISGGQDGNLCLWKDTQKKPVASVISAHGTEATGVPRWIVSSASVKMSDLAASGSHDGYIRLWNAQVSSESKVLRQVSQVAVSGFVNALALSTKLLVAGTGQEHRLGRWWHTKGSFNRIMVWKLPDS